MKTCPSDSRLGFTVYHWDTLDNQTFLLYIADSLDAAEEFIKRHYKDRLRADGADVAEIVDATGTVVSCFSVG